jgi:hypothetical protein
VHTPFARRHGTSARGNPTAKTRPWPTLKTTFFNTQKSVFSQWSAQPQRFATIIATETTCIPKIRHLADAMIIANETMCVPKIRHLADAMIIANETMCVPKIRHLADEMIIEKSMDDGQKYHPLGVPVPHHDLCYNPTIRHLADKKPNLPDGG